MSAAPPPAGTPRLYNLFWSTNPTAGATVIGGSSSLLATLPPVPAMILYPALLTPAVCATRTQSHMELLLLAPRSFGEDTHPQAHQGNRGGGAADWVNRYLKISVWLDPEKWATPMPLFPGPLTDSLLQVTPLGLWSKGKPKLRDAVLSTGTLFKGTIDSRFWDSLEAWEKKRAERAKKKREPAPLELDALYQVRIDLSCLASASPSRDEVDKLLDRDGIARHEKPPPLGLWQTIEPQDELIGHMRYRLEGPNLRSTPGFHVSGRTPGRLDLAGSVTGPPVRAFHPLFVYEELGHARLGHVADLHLNSRQHCLARSPARVIEPDADGSGGSMPVGQNVNIYSDNLLAILDALAQGEKGTAANPGREPIDLLLVGGDLIDHVKNVVPNGRVRRLLTDEKVNAAAVWEAVELDKGLCYEHFVDHLGVYSALKYFLDSYRKPVFVVSGNHDAYEEPYGISPRPLAPVHPKRANEGIPADHNLTFYEAILAFGESYGHTAAVKAIWLHPRLFEWFYTVFTPFADFAAELPKQRLVGLAWGDSEAKLLPSDTADKQGVGHLPRADEGVTERQLQVFDGAMADGSKKVLLFTHFTFVSYVNEIANQTKKVPPPQVGSVGTGTFSRQDWGTFEKGRKQLYSRIHAAAAGAGAGPQLQCVLTGHSHRRGLYYLAGVPQGRKVWALDTRNRLVWIPLFAPAAIKRISEDAYPTLSYPILRGFTAEALKAHAGRTPIIVSDSAGPVPRANLQGEFGQWGSDRPSGTFVRFDAGGVVEQVEQVAATQQARTRPRAAVSIDYLHVNDEQGIVEIVGDRFGWDPPFLGKMRSFAVHFHRRFPLTSVAVTRGMLHCKPTEGAASPFLQVPLQARMPDQQADGSETEEDKTQVVTLAADLSQNRTLLRILNATKTPRFLSLWFRPLLPFMEEQYDFGTGGRWDFEIDCELEGAITTFRWRLIPKVEFPDFKLRKRYFPEQYEKTP